MHNRRALGALLFHDIIGCRGNRTVDAAQPLPDLLGFTPQSQELKRLGQIKNHKECNGERYRTANKEDRTPAGYRDQPRGKKATKNGARVEPVRDQHHHEDTQPLWAVFADKGHRVRHDAAQTHARNEANREQLIHGICEAGHDGDEGEEERGYDQHGPSSDLIGQHTEQQRSHRNSDERCAEHASHFSGVGMPFTNNGRGSVAKGLHVVSIHDQACGAHDVNPYLECAYLAVVNDGADIDLLCSFHFTLLDPEAWASTFIMTGVRVRRE